MSGNNYDFIRKQIIDKALFIFQRVFDNGLVTNLKDLNDDKSQSRESNLFDSLDGESSDVIYKIYIEKLLSEGKLGKIINKICAENQSDQSIQDTKKELIILFENLEKTEYNHENSIPSLKSPRNKAVYDDSEDNRIFFLEAEDREASSHSDTADSQFTFNRCIKNLKQLICTLINETERPRYTPKQFIGFVITILGTMLVFIGFRKKKKR